MDNLLYIHGKPCVCGGHEYVSAIYIEKSITGEWHIMIETQCEDCQGIEVTDIPWSHVTAQYPIQPED